MSNPAVSPYLDNLLELASDSKFLEAAQMYEKARLKRAFETLDKELESAADVESFYIAHATPMGDYTGDWVPAIQRVYETERGRVQLIVGRYFNVPTQGNFHSTRHITLALGLPNIPAKRMFTLNEDAFSGEGSHTDIYATEELVAAFIALGKPVSTPSA